MIRLKIRYFCHFLYQLKGTGLPRIAEIIRQRTAQWATTHPEEAQVWIDDFCGDQRFCCDLSEHMGSQIFFKGSYSGGQLVVLRRLLGPDAVFVDAGANQGEFTVCAGGALSIGHVFAFEPVPAVRELLERNVTGNRLNNVTVHPMGLSDVSRDNVPIFGANSEFTDGTQHIGLPTLFEVSGRSHLLAHIHLRRLDDVLQRNQRVDVIKVDVEGAELAVLQGAEVTILREKPAIIFEANEETCKAAGYHLGEIFDWLRERGYELADIDQEGRLTPLVAEKAFENVLATHELGFSAE